MKNSVLILFFLVSVLAFNPINAQSMGNEAGTAPTEELITNQIQKRAEPAFSPYSVKELTEAFMKKHKVTRKLLKKANGMEREQKLGWAALGLAAFAVIGMVIGILAIFRAREQGLVGLGLGFIGVFLGFFAIVAFIIAIPFFAIWLKWKRRQQNGVF